MYTKVQLDLVVCFYDNHQIEESFFLHFSTVRDFTGPGLVKHIIRLFFEFGLDMSNLVQIDFNESSSMSNLCNNSQDS